MPGHSQEGKSRFHRHYKRRIFHGRLLHSPHIDCVCQEQRRAPLCHKSHSFAVVSDSFQMKQDIPSDKRQHKIYRDFDGRHFCKGWELMRPCHHSGLVRWRSAECTESLDPPFTQSRAHMMQTYFACAWARCV